jgi:hypothetical protein
LAVTSRSAWAVGFALVTLACAAALRAQLFSFEPLMWLNTDEGYAAALATRLLDRGGLPYVDAISLRGPLMYWIYEVVLAVGRPESLAAIRFAGAAWTIALVLGVASIPAILGSPLAAGMASLICVSSLTVFWSPADGLAWNAEVIGLPFVLAGTALAIAAVSRRPAERLSWLFGSGVLAGCAFFV